MISMDFCTCRAVSSVQQTVDELQHLWDSVSLEDDQRIRRINRFCRCLEQKMGRTVSGTDVNEICLWKFISTTGKFHLCNLQLDCERRMIESVHSDIDRWLKDIRELRDILLLPPFNCSGYKEGSYALVGFSILLLILIFMVKFSCYFVVTFSFL